ncbi:MAG: WD40/YVTN/BNR-like repeat-containing protein [Ferruginibacter sp.]
MKTLHFILLFLLYTSLNEVQAQRKIPEALQRQLIGKTKVVDIMHEVELYYQNGTANLGVAGDEEAFEGNDYDRWKKWEYWAMRRLNPDGTLANFNKKNYEATEQVKTQFATQLQTGKQQVAQARANQRQLNERAPRAYNQDGLRSYGDWSYLGPYDGGTIVGSGTNIDINGQARMDRIAFHPTDANVFFVCSPSGGIYKTTDGGSIWEPIGNGLPNGIACIGVSKSSPNTVYAFSGDGESHTSGLLVFNYNLSPNYGGMFKSTDGGYNWTKISTPGTDNNIGHNIAISSNNSNFLFVATQEGLYRTTNGGTSWEQVRSGKHYDVEFKPYNDSTVYCSTDSTIHYSSNGGRLNTWNKSTLDVYPTLNSSRVNIAVRYNNLNQASTAVYALFNGAATNRFSGLYLSLSDGVGFSQQCTTPNILGTVTDGSDNATLGSYGNSITVRPDNYAILATGSLCIWRSNGSNSGTSMVYSSTYREGLGPATAYAHPDIHDVKYNPADNNLYACSDGGVYKSTDDGVTWTDISAGLQGTQFYHMAMKDSDGNGEMDGLEIAGGAQDNGIKYRTNTGAWRHLACCDGYGVSIKGTDGPYAIVNFNDRIYTTSNGGTNMTYRGTTGFFSPIAIDYDFDDTMYVASSGGLKRSYNSFGTSTNTGVDVSNFVVTCPSNNNRLMGSASARTNLRISDDRGSTWTTISANTGWPAGSPIVTDAKVWPTVSSEIYVCFGGYTNGVKVYRSTDDGANWSNYSGSLPNVPIHSLCVATEGVYAGSEIGVFFRPDGGADWVPFYTGMPIAIVTDMWVNENGLIYASTFGRGIWLGSRYTACTANINVSGTLDGSHFYEASNSATVTANSYSGNNTEIFVKSNNYIDLKEGFEIKNQTFFKAYLNPCATGGIPNSNRLANGMPGYIRLIEYDDKDKKLHQKKTTAYYSIVDDGIEVNVPGNQNTRITASVTSLSGETILIVNDQIIHPGMYKIPWLNATSGASISINGMVLPRVQ